MVRAGLQMHCWPGIVRPMTDAKNWRTNQTFESTGYRAGGPVQPQDWLAFAGDQPRGLAIQQDGAPPGFVIVQNFLPPPLCEQIVAELNRDPGVQSTVGENTESYRSQVRTSEYIDPANLQTNVTQILRIGLRTYVEPFYRIRLEWFEQPEILRYRAGGEFKPHADADVFDRETNTWRRQDNRDVSVLLYLNEGFGGGEIVFPNFGLKLAPRQGLLLAFPADGRYAHHATAVTQGVKYTAVTWAAAEGTPRDAYTRNDVIRL